MKRNDNSIGWVIRHVLTLTMLTFCLGAAVLAQASLDRDVAGRNDNDDDGAVYVATNATTGNEVLVYKRSESNGALRFSGRFSTGGLGSGGGLGNQGGLILSNNQRWLFVVNAGSNDITAFRVMENGLRFADKAPSGGTQPISLSFRNGLLYVLNAASDNIAGFEFWDGDLRPLAGSSRPLSGAGTGSAQISFSPDGDSLVVTEKATNRIVIYSVGRNGYPGQPVVRQSVGQTPFGFSFGRNNLLIVSEAFGGAAGASAVSSYRLNEQTDDLKTISPSVATTQTAACWVVLTPNGRVAFVTNTASNTISSYRITFNGTLTLLEAAAATTGGGPIDITISNDGRFLYTVNRSGGSLGAYRIGNNGSLTAISGGEVSGLPTSINGIASR